MVRTGVDLALEVMAVTHQLMALDVTVTVTTRHLISFGQCESASGQGRTTRMTNRVTTKWSNSYIGATGNLSRNHSNRAAYLVAL